ncbi:GNAT family N-acetyltransferase [Pseudomonas sp. NPDC096917]|uniref:GNAT family N-acetyltransferase n=1 Tax=Pseudomonas sp. NPDC096917 TaxID=3364483 RepID=UPI00383A1687
MSEYCLLLRKDLRQALAPAQWPEGIQLSPLSEELLPRAHALLEQGYATGQGSVDSLLDWQHALRHDAEYDPQLCFVGLLDNNVVGVAQAWTSAYLKDLVVHPRLQGRGLGGALLNHVFSVFQQRGEPCMDLKVMEHNHPARRLYQRHGMLLIRREPL